MTPEELYMKYKGYRAHNHNIYGTVCGYNNTNRSLIMSVSPKCKFSGWYLVEPEDIIYGKHSNGYSFIYGCHIIGPTFKFGR